MPAKYLLGIDNGGTVAKAALFTCDGREVAVASSKTEAITPRPGWIEFDMDRLWQATAASVRQAIARSGVPAREIAAVACTGHGNGLYLVDDGGRPVRTAIFSADCRARSYVERWTAEGVDRAVRPKTMQALWPGQPNAILAWIADHQPEVLRKTRWALMCKDFVRMRLTGEAWGELTDMSGTSLLDVGTCQYDSAVLEAFGIAAIRDKLPPLRLSADVCGSVTAVAAEETGLVAGTPVAGGMFDIDACALSSALTDESQLGMTFGTWGINQYVSPAPVVDDVFMTSRYCLPGYYLMLEGSATSASNLEWFLGQWFPDAAAAAGTPGQSPYDSVNRWVAESDPAQSGLLFFPFLYGSNVAADASACLVGMNAGHGRKDVARAVYEGVVFGHRTHLDRLLRFRAMPERIRASGGAARSDAWMQIAADVFQVPVEVPEGTELGALGAAICASVAVGVHADYRAACAAMVRLSRRFAPNPDLAGVYRAKFARYQQFLKVMEPAWKSLVWPAD
jgi:L-xylulokinase